MPETDDNKNKDGKGDESGKPDDDNKVVIDKGAAAGGDKSDANKGGDKDDKGGGEAVELDFEKPEVQAAVTEAAKKIIADEKREAARKAKEKQGDHAALYEDEKKAHADTQRELWKARAAIKYNLAEADLEFITGDDEATVMRNAQKFAKRVADKAEGDERSQNRRSPGGATDTKGARNPKDKTGKGKENVRNNIRGALGLGQVKSSKDDE